MPNVYGSNTITEPNNWLWIWTPVLFWETIVSNCASHHLKEFKLHFNYFPISDPTVTELTTISHAWIIHIWTPTKKLEIQRISMSLMVRNVFWCGSARFWYKYIVCIYWFLMHLHQSTHFVVVWQTWISPLAPNGLWEFQCYDSHGLFTLFPHLWLTVLTLTPPWLILPTLVTHLSHTYSTITHQPLLYFYYIYS